MGYYTRFELEIRGAVERWVTGVDEKSNTVCVNIGAAPDRDELKKQLIVAVGYNPFDNDTWKWYDHDADMRKFSRLHPTLVFVLSGRGEEPDDIWRCYYKAGKAQYEKGRTEYGAFDPELLMGR